MTSLSALQHHQYVKFQSYYEPAKFHSNCFYTVQWEVGVVFAPRLKNSGQTEPYMDVIWFLIHIFMGVAHYKKQHVDLLARKQPRK